MTAPTTSQLVANAWKAGIAVPAFNIPHLEIMGPIVRALRQTETFGLIQVARLEWEKFHAVSLQVVRAEYEKLKDERFTRLHLDHVPVIDEDDVRVDFEPIIAEAIELGFESVMVDGSRLGLDENITATRKIARMAHDAGIPAEGELGAVLGHESGPMPSYEELFASGRGFTDPDEARRFADETGVDWLSVAIGNIHGAISGAAKSQRKVQARLDLEHLDRLSAATGIPLVLHGGSGIRKDHLLAAAGRGIAKINIGTTIRQAYEAGLDESLEAARRNVFDTAVGILTEELEVAGSAGIINPVPGIASGRPREKRAGANTDEEKTT